MNRQVAVSTPQKDPAITYPIHDRFSLFWLALAFGFLLFSNGMQLIPIATWIGPVFLLRFMRSQKTWLALLLGYITNTVAFTIYWRPAFQDAGEMFALYSIAFALIFFLPYLLDRFLKPHIPGLIGTLILPAAFVVTEYLIHLVSPLGTFFLLPYTQSSNLSLLQIMSITGMWGVTFLIAWFASVVNYAWEGGFDPRRAGKGVMFYAAILTSVLFFGGMRLALEPITGTTVKVAVLTTNINEEVMPEPDSPMELRLTGGSLTQADREEMTQKMNAINNDLLTRTRQQAQAGSKIVTWTEYNAQTWTDSEEQFKAQVRQLAREEKIYLVFPLIVIEPEISQRPAPEIVYVNKSVMITPQGEIAYEYVKHNLLVGYEGDHALRGGPEIHTLDTSYGRLASVICLDMEYPDFNRQAGQQGVDIMLSGAIDGTPSTGGNPIHSAMASYRSIEEGFSLARGGFYGANIAVDYLGRLQGTANHLSAVDRTVVAQLPVKGTKTLYSRLGDFFPWTCLALLAFLTAAALVRALRKEVHPVLPLEPAEAKS